MSSQPEKPTAIQDQTDTRPPALVVALVVMALGLGLMVWRMQPPAPKSVAAPSGEFSAGRALVVLRELLAEGTPHPIGSESSDRLRERIVARLEALGYQVQVQETTVCLDWWGAATTCGPVKNILTRLPGQGNGPAVLLLAHYDSAGAGPGAADDTSGVATIIEIARILKEQGPHRNPIIFLLSDGEEVGLLGASAFVAEHPWAKDVGVVINLEARGTNGQSLMFETSEGNAWLIAAYAAAVPLPATNSLMYEAYRALPNDTDLTVFRKAGKAGINLAFIEGSSRYHTSLDNLAYLDLGSLQHHGESALALAGQLAAIDLSNPPAGDAAFTDLLGLGLLWWPAAWTLPLAVLALLLLLAAAAWLICRHRLTIGALLWGILATLLTVLPSIALGLGLTWLISTVTGVANPWYAYPLPTRLALWVGALLCGGLAAALLARRAGAWGLGLGAWFFGAILALTLSFLVPGAAIVLLVPTLVAALLLVVASALPGSALAREIILIAAAFLAGLFWLQLALRFEYALGFNVSYVITLPVGLTVSTLLPLWSLPKGRTLLRKALIVAAAAGTVIAAGVAMLVPTYSPSDPQKLNIYYFEEQDSGTAHWVAIAAPNDVPASLRPLFDQRPAAVLPWSTFEFPVAEAAASGDLAPSLELISNQVVAGNRVVEARLRSPRGGTQIDLLVPVDSLESLAVAGKTFSVDPAKSWNGFYNLFCYGSPCDGLALTLRFKSGDPAEVLLLDYTHGLPPAGTPFLQARPATAVPAYDGDLTILLRRIKF